jgi:hypothetical protein
MNARSQSTPEMSSGGYALIAPSLADDFGRQVREWASPGPALSATPHSVIEEVSSAVSGDWIRWWLNLCLD